MKKSVNIFVFLALLVISFSILIYAGFNFGMPGAVKSKVKELDEKVRQKKAEISGSTAQSLSGTAAKGKAIASATISIKDADGLSKTATTGTDGKYTVDVKALAFPMLLKVTDGNITYFSVANASGTCNIHPFTDLVVRTYFKSSKGVSDMNATFENNFASLGTLPTVETINTIKSVVATIVSTILERQGIDPLTYDMFTTPFDANSSGFDRTIEETQITAANDYGYVVIKDSTTDMVISTVKPTANDTTAPEVPTDLSVSGVSGTSIKLHWTASPGTDIAGYAIYRGVVKIAVVSYTTYIDVGLTEGTQYSYTVEAYDWVGNKSAKTSPVTGTTPTEFPILADPAQIKTGAGIAGTGIALQQSGANYLLTASYLKQPPVSMNTSKNIIAQLVSPQSGALVGPLIYVSTPASGSIPAAAGDGNNFMVVWNDYGGTDGGDIYGQRISSSGNLVDSPILIKEGAGRGEGGNPQIGFDGTNYLVVWEDCRISREESDIYGQFVSSSGVLVGPEIAISTAANIQKNMSINYGNNRYLVVWSDNRYGVTSNPSDIYGRFVSTSGALLDPEIAIDVNNYESEWGAYSAFDSVNDRFFVTFHDELVAPSVEVDLYGRFVDSDGSVSSKIIISNKPGAQAIGIPTFDGTKYLVVWNDGFGTAYAKNQAAFFDANGNRLGNEITLLTKKGTENFIGAGAGFGGNKYFAIIYRATVNIQPDGEYIFTAGDIYGMIFNP